MNEIRKRAIVYEKLKPTLKSLTGSADLDKALLAAFHTHFPSADIHNLKGIDNPDEWARLSEEFADRINDRDDATVLKADEKKPLAAKNIVIVNRLIWLCIEIARRTA